MLSSLILILREVLEAGLIMSALLAAARIRQIGARSFGIGLLGGVIGAAIIAGNMDAISNIGEGIGQELLNALLDGAIIVLLAGCCASALAGRDHALLRWGAAGAIACAGAREFSEIAIYVSGFSTSFSAFMPVLIGGIIGTGIGLSIAALLYYLLAYQPPRRALRITSGLLALIAAAMAAEAVGFLEQAGVLPAQQPWWNTSQWIDEGSAYGQLLHALIGYEATPTPLQIAAYVVVLLLIGALAAIDQAPRANITAPMEKRA